MAQMRTSLSDPMVDASDFNEFNTKLIEAMSDILTMKITLIERRYRENAMSEDSFESAMKKVELLEGVLVECSRYRSVIEVKNRHLAELFRTNTVLSKELRFLKNDKE
jgi:hypothetical protein